MSSSSQGLRARRPTRAQLGVAAGVLLVLTLVAVVLVGRTTSDGSGASATAPTSAPTTLAATPAASGGSGAGAGAPTPADAGTATTVRVAGGPAAGSANAPAPVGASPASSTPVTTPVVLSDPDAFIGVDAGPGSPRPPLAQIPVTVSVAPGTGSSGQTLDIHVAATGGSQVFGFEARLCAANVSVAWDADFNPTQGGKCIAHKLTATADAKLEAIAAPPFQSVDATFHVGAGLDTYEVQGAGPTTIDCSSGRTCQLVLKIQVPNGFGFRSQTVTVA